MRVLLIAPPWLPVPPPSYGGTEAVVDQLARGLAAAGHDVVLYTTGDSTCPVERRWVFETAQTARIGDMTVELRHMLHAYEQADEFDVVHDHTLMGPVLAAAGGHLPVVTTNHGPFDDDLGPIYRSIASRVPVIAISAHQAGSATRTPIARVIHHGVDPADFPVGRGSGGYVACLGRMAPTKGIDIAARMARAAGVPLRIAAKMREPAERDYFDSAVRPLLGGDIEYLGELDATEKLELLGDATALLNPIRWNEPFGMVMIEALACGTPVVAPPRGSVPEIVDHGRTGWLSADEAELVGRLGDLDALDRAECREVVETRFSTRRMVDEHLEVYRATAEHLAPVLDLTGTGRPVRPAPAMAAPEPTVTAPPGTSAGRSRSDAVG
jgi:glycosyltransferase involved in cell wall biosynthesis